MADVTTGTDGDADFLADAAELTLGELYARLYERELELVDARHPGEWGALLRPVLAVCLAAGPNPVLPRRIAAVAVELMEGPKRDSLMRFDDALDALSALILRSQPDEHLGIFHASLVEEYFGQPDRSQNFHIRLDEAHSKIVDAIAILAPADQHDPSDELHRYAMEAEPDHLWSAGRYDEIVACLEARRLHRAIDERQRWQRWTDKIEEHPDLGSESKVAVDVRENLARWTGEAGDPKEAARILSNLLPLRERFSEGNVRDIIRTRGRLAYYTAKIGELADASERYHDLLELCRDSFDDENDPTTLETWRDYARFTGEAGHPQTASDQLEQLLAIYTGENREDDERAVAVAENLARFTGEGGDPRGARDRYREVLPRRRRISEPKRFPTP